MWNPFKQQQKFVPATQKEVSDLRHDLNNVRAVANLQAFVSPGRDAKVTALDARVKTMESRITNIEENESKLELRFAQKDDIFIEQIRTLDARVAAVESKLNENLLDVLNNLETLAKMSKQGDDLFLQLSDQVKTLSERVAKQQDNWNRLFSAFLPEKHTRPYVDPQSEHPEEFDGSLPEKDPTLKQILETPERPTASELYSNVRAFDGSLPDVTKE